MNNKICIYLRKSRADEELEKSLGEGETLRKHKTTLLDFAKNNNLNIVEIKEEIVSGDSLFFRPKMLELLQEVEQKQYYGVLVMDIDRLGRGGMKDQGMILEAFKESNTKIITPGKTYDLNNEYDEEMTEFKTFFARRELKVINKRMQGGRIRSIENGNYISTTAPYGYSITFIDKSRTLKIVDEEADVVKMIFQKYIEGNGAGTISSYLDSIGIKNRSNNSFDKSSILFILKNPIYIGKVTWKKKEIKKSKDPNKVKDTRTRDRSEWIISDGKHKAIIDNETWEKAQSILQNKYHVPYQINNAPVNPLAGLIICGVCGKKMVLRNLRGIDRIICINNKCDNISNRFDTLEKNIINELERYLENYSISITANEKQDNKKTYEKQLNLLKQEIETLKKQKEKLYDLLERGIYTDDVFLERNKNIDDRIRKVSNALSAIDAELDKCEMPKMKPKEIKKIIDGYKKTSDVKLKNELMKSILFKVEYIKKQKGNDFEVRIYPKIKSLNTP